MNLTTKIGHYEFNGCLMNASGIWCSTEEELKAVKLSQAATFVTKTATLEEREGNPQPRVHHFGSNSINSSGLPNLGLAYYLEVLDQFHKDYPEDHHFLSVTELSEDKIDLALSKINQSNFNGLVELNLSCPNVVGKPQVAYDFDTTDRILKRTFSYFEKPLGVKLPPYFDPSHFDHIAEILSQYPITFINAINSVGNGLVIDDETVTIKPKNGFGGLGGALIKQTALANVRALYTRLGDKMAIIGTGGVQSGRDVFEHILCGASMVQVGTHLLQAGPEIFSRLNEELRAIMTEKGYESIADFQGRLIDQI